MTLILLFIYLVSVTSSPLFPVVCLVFALLTHSYSFYCCVTFSSAAIQCHWSGCSIGRMEDCPFLFHPLMPALLFFFPFLPSKRSTERYNQPCTYCSFPVLLAVLHKKKKNIPQTRYDLICLICFSTIKDYLGHPLSFHI